MLNEQSSDPDMATVKAPDVSRPADFGYSTAKEDQLQFPLPCSVLKHHGVIRPTPAYLDGAYFAFKSDNPSDMGAVVSKRDNVGAVVTAFPRGFVPRPPYTRRHNA
jgi:hypothetical protein